LLLALLLSACQSTGPVIKGPVSGPVTPVDETPVISPKVAAAAEALTRMAAMQDRLYKVAAPLLINNAELCKAQARNLLGFTARNRYWYPGEYNEAAHVAFGMGERLQVTGVLAGSGAARAGLRTGDKLMAVEDKLLPLGANAEAAARQILGPLASSKATVKLTVQRGDAELVIPVPLTRACAMRAAFGNARIVNSYADGNRVLVTAGLMSLAQSDEELAYVIAKDMAHNILNHPDKMRMNATIGGVIDNLEQVRPDLSMTLGTGGIKPMPQDMDAAADRFSLYLLLRAGYNIDRIGRFWQKVADQVPLTVLNGHTALHPSVAYRLASLEKAVDEVKAKQNAKKPLLP
ncbi:MAG TPA: M48 family metallopeptidase, partial [Burkholderiaceae bacterium]